MLETVIQYLVAGRLFTIFYLRCFTFSKHGPAMMTDLMLLMLNYVVSDHFGGHTGQVVAVLSLLVTRSNNQYIIESKTKSLVTSLALYAAVHCPDLSTLHTLSLLGALSQFIRSPGWLRDMLREPRLVLGPIHPIMVLATGRFVSSVGQQSVVYLLAMCCVVIAALFLRPDNVQVADLFPTTAINSNYNRRRLAHGALMFCSVCCMMYNVPQDDLWLKPVFGLICVMYGILKLGARKIKG